MSRTLLLAWLVVATSGTAQTTPPLLQRVAWPLADFVVLGDSTHGVQLLASPNLRSEQGRSRVEGTTLSLDPSVVHLWASGVTRVLDSVSRLPPRERTVFETAPLATNLGHGRILIAFDGKGSQEQPFAFVVKGVAESWWLPVSNSQVQQLLGVLDTIARLSTLTPSPFGNRGALLICQLDERPQPVEPIRLEHPDRGRHFVRNARVLARYLIDTSGVIPPASVDILLSDGKDFSREAQRALARAKYRPGRAGGRPVETIVWQWFVFRSLR